MIRSVLSLALLVRSVALLPHNLEKVKVRRRRRSPPMIMTTRTAWIPPLLAGLVCGLQLSFWQNAIASSQLTSSTGASFPAAVNWLGFVPITAAYWPCVTAVRPSQNGCVNVTHVTRRSLSNPPPGLGFVVSFSRAR